MEKALVADTDDDDDDNDNKMFPLLRVRSGDRNRDRLHIRLGAASMVQGVLEAIVAVEVVVVVKLRWRWWCSRSTNRRCRR